jgi:NADP-dependent 3-hydroxy acid dehydrogenase YdfG
MSPAFRQPILHGLCAYGVAGHAVLRTLCGYDGTRLRRFDVRFTSPVYPGETIRRRDLERRPGTRIVPLPGDRARRGGARQRTGRIPGLMPGSTVRLIRRPGDEDMGQLDGKVAIVTGSGRGIGQQIALRLARDGAAVVVNDLDEAPGPETVKLIEAAGGRAVACNGDVTAVDFGPRIVRTAVETFGDAHIIVNNAGYTWDSVIQKMSDEQWYAIIDVHLTAPFRILRAFFEHLKPASEREQKDGRRVVRKVVNISSTSGINGNAGQANYSSGKAGSHGPHQGTGQGVGPLCGNRQLGGLRLHPDAPDHARCRRARPGRSTSTAGR